jgi:hypothetical protein
MESKGCKTTFRETTRPKKRQGCGGTVGKAKKTTLKVSTRKCQDRHSDEDHFDPSHEGSNTTSPIQTKGTQTSVMDPSVEVQGYSSNVLSPCLTWWDKVKGQLLRHSLSIFFMTQISEWNIFLIILELGRGYSLYISVLKKYRTKLQSNYLEYLQIFLGIYTMSHHILSEPINPQSHSLWSE